MPVKIITEQANAGVTKKYSETASKSLYRNSYFKTV